MSNVETDNALFDFKYTTLGNGTCTLDGARRKDPTAVDDCCEVSLVIPERMANGDTVVYIKADALSGIDWLSEVTLPDTVTKIGNNAFRNCYALQKVHLGRELEHIGRHAFSDCVALKEINWPDALFIICRGAFSGCISLTEATLPESLHYIDGYAFAYTGLVSVRIPDNVSRLDNGVFKNCRRLTTVIFGKGITKIGNWVFDHCTALCTITLPDSVTEIGTDAFNTCISLQSMVIPEGVTKLEEGAFIGCLDLETVILPSTLTTIGACAFDGCASLRHINMPESVTYIGEEAFDRCLALSIRRDIKATHGDYTCLHDFKFKLNKWYRAHGKIQLCRNGFHFVQNAYDVFNYYAGTLGKDVRLFFVDTAGVSNDGEDSTEDSKRVCRKIKLTHEISSYAELFNMN